MIRMTVARNRPAASRLRYDVEERDDRWFGAVAGAFSERGCKESANT